MPYRDDFGAFGADSRRRRRRGASSLDAGRRVREKRSRKYAVSELPKFTLWAFSLGWVDYYLVYRPSILSLTRKKSDSLYIPPIKA